MSLKGLGYSKGIGGGVELGGSAELIGGEGYLGVDLSLGVGGGLAGWGFGTKSWLFTSWEQVQIFLEGLLSGKKAK